MLTLMSVITCVVGVVLFFSIGCWVPVKDGDLVGSFRMNSKWACGNLKLSSDHTFHQDLSKGCGANHLYNTGTWKVDLENDKVITISLTPFLGRNPDNDEVETFGFTDFTVNRLKWGTVKIVIDPDAGISYDKQ
jgi:hypothetical protein